MQPLIELQDLTHTYVDGANNEVLALDKINLQIQQGEFLAVIGANGCGKSTLAKHLNALLLPTAGRCLINGMDTQDEKHLWDIRQTVGMVFQNPDNQIVAAIVEEDVAFGLENIGVPHEEIRPRVEAALKAVNMSAYALHAPHLLSGGQKQRVAIAGVVALEPRCIVMDEPTAMLDPLGRKEIMATVKKLQQEKQITFVYITHYMTEAMQADRVLVMDHGRIIMQGKPAEIFSQVAKLQALHLEAPLAATVAADLRRAGLQVPLNIITNEELAAALCQ